MIWFRRATDRVHRRLILGLLLAAVLLVIPRPAAAIVERLSLQELTLRSHLILYGTVAGVKSGLDPTEGIVTNVQITVDGEIKGHAPGEVVLRLPGGVVGDLGLGVSDVPHFLAGERVVVFLEPAKGGGFRVTGWDQGKFVLQQGLTCNHVTELCLPAVDFVRQIARLMSDHGIDTNLPPNWEAELHAFASRAVEPDGDHGLDDFVYNGQHWPGPSPMGEPYLVNVNTSDPGDMLGAILAAASTWSNVLTADFVFTYGGHTSATDRSSSPNGANEIVWKNEGDNRVLATTYWWYQGGTGHIVEADMVINDYYDWDTSGQPDGSSFDLQSVALHEFGHYLSLGHDSDPAAAMYAYLAGGEVKRVLHPNDVAGIAHIYPASTTPTPGPSPTPTKSPTRTPTPTSTPPSASTPTSTPTRTPTVTPTPLGFLAGRVILQGRSDHSGATVAAGASQVLTGLGGGFECSLPPGSYTLSISRPGYLTAQVVGVTVYAGQTTTLEGLVLPGGDTDSNGKVDIFDLVLVGTNFGSSPPGDPRADLTNDNRVDLFDLVLVGSNFGRRSPVSVSTAQSRADGPGRKGARLQVLGWPPVLQPGETAVVELRLQGASGLYGAEVHLDLDPRRLEVLDAQPGLVGVQAAPGELLDPGGGFVAQNLWDPLTGRLDYTVALLAPALPGHGDGVLARFTVRARGEGTVMLRVADARLADAGAVPIPVVTEAGALHVGRVYRLYVPLLAQGER